MGAQKGLIILDGPDGTGKTTLARALVARHGAAYLHLTYRWPTRMHLYHLAAILHALSKDRPVVLDRWWPSELLYAAEYRGGSPWPQAGRLLDRLALRHGALYVLCLPTTLGVYEKQYQQLKAKRAEMYESTVGVAARYLNLYDGNGHGKFSTADYAGDLAKLGGLQLRDDVLRYRINVEGQEIIDFCDRLMAKLTLPVVTQQHDLSFKNLLGRPGPTCQRVFVGDEPNVTSPRTCYPFFTLDGCSGFFLRACARLNLDESRQAFVNINHDRGVPTLREVLDISPAAVPIILGKRALRTYDRFFTREPRCLPHPQWYRRFHHHDGLLEADLRRALCIDP